jgi:quercetin dioxygenase-like cupin family protein
MNEGDYLLIPSGVPHRVARTDEQTVWLAVRIGS